jgi:hypothetical protein
LPFSHEADRPKTKAALAASKTGLAGRAVYSRIRKDFCGTLALALAGKSEEKQGKGASQSPPLSSSAQNRWSISL